MNYIDIVNNMRIIMNKKNYSIEDKETIIAKFEKKFSDFKIPPGLLIKAITDVLNTSGGLAPKD